MKLNQVEEILDSNLKNYKPDYEDEIFESSSMEEEP